MKNTLFIIIAITLLIGCKGNGRGFTDEASLQAIPMLYAKNLTIFEGEKYSIAELRDPWDTTKLLNRYILIPKEEPLPAKLPQGVIVRTPLSNSMIYTTIHCKVVNELQAIESIGGVCELEYINIPEIHKRHKEGKLINAGKGTNPDIEKIIELSPDAILLSPFENGGGYGAIEKLGIPIIECADYMEQSALGSAEWIRFYGLLFGKKQIADSIFTHVENQYNTLKAIATTKSHKPKVMYGLKSGSAWYVPAGGSAVAKLMEDAGANYIFAESTGSGSIPQSFEKVFEEGEDSDIWLIRYYQTTDKTYAELKAEFEPYSEFKPFKTKQIYHCNTSYSTYYEDFPFHPELILKELIAIFHPGTFTDHKAKYYLELGISN